jgi:hypothetical protein
MFVDRHYRKTFCHSSGALNFEGSSIFWGVGEICTPIAGYFSKFSEDFCWSQIDFCAKY